MELTKDDMPDHPRFEFYTSIDLSRNPHKMTFDEVRIQDLKGDDLESAVAIAFVHFATKMPLSINNQHKADKWLSLLMPNPVFGKDWNGWEWVEYSSGPVTIHFREHEEKPCGAQNWKRVLRTVKVIE